MSFKDQGWDRRFESMGDMAEAQFEGWMQKRQRGYVRYGLDRPPIQMHKLPARLRYTPDYLCSNQFVEVQGFGQDQTFKLKLDKHGALHWWNDLHPVAFFVYDSRYERACMIELPALDQLLNTGQSTMQSFAEGKPYFAFNGDQIMSAGTLCNL
jgi:hypothetical protein